MDSQIELAAAVFSADGPEIITAATHKARENLRNEIRRWTRELTDKPFV